MFDTVNVTTTPLRFIDDILPKEGDEGGRGVVSRPTNVLDRHASLQLRKETGGIYLGTYKFQ